MRESMHKNPIDRLSHADSVIALLGGLDIERFPTDERIAVASLQVEAIEEWLAAYLENTAEGARMPPAAGH